MQVMDRTTDAVEVVRTALEGGEVPAAMLDGGLAILSGRLDRVRAMGGRFALVDASPEVAGMLKAVGRARLTC